MRLTDVHRSLRRWTGFVLGEDWILRLEQRLASEDDLRRDIGFVELAIPMSSVRAGSGGGGLPQGDVQRAATFSITLLPVAAETPQEASLRATELAEMLFRAAESGIVDYETGASLAPAMEIPIWDWEGFPVRGPNRAGPDGPYLRVAEVRDLSSRPLPDPEDDLLYSVVCTLRLSWWVGGRGPAPAPPATGGISPAVDPPLRV